MFEKIEARLTTGCRAGIALILLIAGIIWQVCSEKLLSQGAYYLMATAMFCFVTVILTKWKPHMIQYVIFNMILLIVILLLGEAETIEGTVMYTLWILCLLGDWALNAWLLKAESIGKRIGLGALAMFLNVILAGAVYLIPILLW